MTINLEKQYQQHIWSCQYSGQIIHNATIVVSHSYIENTLTNVGSFVPFITKITQNDASNWQSSSPDISCFEFI